MAKIPKLLSKSKIMRGYQCLKSIYQAIHNKELETPVGPEQQAVFDQGTYVGEVARCDLHRLLITDYRLQHR